MSVVFIHLPKTAAVKYFEALSERIQDLCLLAETMALQKALCCLAKANLKTREKLTAQHCIALMPLHHPVEARRIPASPANCAAASGGWPCKDIANLINIVWKTPVTAHGSRLNLLRMSGECRMTCQLRKHPSALPQRLEMTGAAKTGC